MSRGIGLGAAVAIIGGFAVTTGAATFAAIYVATKTGDPRLDRPTIRARVVARCMAAFAARPTLIRACSRAAMLIVRQETRGDASYYLGDLDGVNGPGVGPMQVDRGTAKALGLWSPPEGISSDEEERAAYAEMAADEGWGIKAGVAVLKAKLDDDARLDNVGRGHLSGGILSEAVRLYNGWSAAATSYRDQVVSFANAVYAEGLS